MRIILRDIYGELVACETDLINTDRLDHAHGYCNLLAHVGNRVIVILDNQPREVAEKALRHLHEYGCVSDESL